MKNCEKNISKLSDSLLEPQQYIPLTNKETGETVFFPVQEIEAAGEEKDQLIIQAKIFIRKVNVIRKNLKPEGVTATAENLRKSPLLQVTSARLGQHLWQVYQEKLEYNLQLFGLDAIDPYLSCFQIKKDANGVPVEFKINLNAEQIIQHNKRILNSWFDDAGVWNNCAKWINENLILWALDAMEKESGEVLISMSQTEWDAKFQEHLAAETERGMTELGQRYSQEVTNALVDGLDLQNRSIRDLEDLLGVREQPRQSASVRQSALYAIRNMEPRPNHAAVADLLAILPYPHKWKDYGIEYGSARIDHSKERYVQYELFNTDSTGDLIPIALDAQQQIINQFDWIDHKILSILLMRSLESKGGKFILSLNWLSELISDDRNRQAPDITGKRHYLSRSEKLQDLERRIRRLRSLFLQVKWHEGEGKKQKVCNLLMREGMTRIEFALFIVRMMWVEQTDNKQDVLVEIEPGSWFLILCDNVRQFTWIPKDLLSIDTYRNGRRYAIGDYVLREYRSGVNNLKEVADYKTSQPVRVLHRKLDTLVKEVLQPEEVEYALTTSYKGCRLKKAILDDFEYFRGLGWYVSYQFPDGGFREFLAGFLDIAPSTDIAEPIQRVSSRQKAKKAPSRRKQATRQAPKSGLTGEQIKEARSAKGWSQRELVSVLSAYVGVSQRKISFWESGKSCPTSQEAEKLKRVLGIKDSV